MTDANEAKHSLAFILDRASNDDPIEPILSSPPATRPTNGEKRLNATRPQRETVRDPSNPRDSRSSIGSSADEDLPPPAPHARAAAATSVSRRRPMTPQEKRMARQCSVDGCENYTIDRGLCFRHGGGKTCSVDGCDRSAKARGLCWRHGGSVTCTTPGCTRGAKSRGLCWTHGGGTKCSVPDCDKTTISKGLCWTHGGGKRCTFDGCKRPASESKYNFCNRHHAELRDGNCVYEV